MACWLRASTALPEDLGLALSIHIELTLSGSQLLITRAPGHLTQVPAEARDNYHLNCEFMGWGLPFNQVGDFMLWHKIKLSWILSIYTKLLFYLSITVTNDSFCLRIRYDLRPPTKPWVASLQLLPCALPTLFPEDWRYSKMKNSFQ